MIASQESTYQNKTFKLVARLEEARLLLDLEDYTILGNFAIEIVKKDIVASAVIGLREIFSVLQFPPSDARLHEEYKLGEEIKNRELGAFILSPEGIIKVIILIKIGEDTRIVIEEFKLKKVRDLPPPEDEHLDPIIKTINDLKAEIVNVKAQSQEQIN